MYFTHTKESITVTYKRNGRYDEKALKKINWFLRDWRRNEPTRMSRETVDLLWELHADLGSRKPVHIISAYRSPRTNAMLRRIGRKVARKSQHMRGNAIDFYFPDVPIEKVMGSALVRKIGGVGYYPRSGKHGFVHIDNGNVRHWPRMRPSRYARISRKYARTVNARRGGTGNTLLAAANTKNFVKPRPSTTRTVAARQQQSGPVSLLSQAMLDNPALAAMARNKAPAPSANAAPALAAAAPARSIMPKPRPKPIEVLMLAAASMKISPASAPAKVQNFGATADTTLARGSLGPIDLTSAGYEDRTALLASNASAKGSLNNADQASSELRPLSVTYANTSSLSDLFTNSDEVARRDGAPQPFVLDEQNRIPTLDNEEKSALARLIEAFTGGSEAAKETPLTSSVNRSGKADSQLVNRSGKGDFQTSGGASSSTWKQSEANATKVLKLVEAPLSFNQ